MWNIQKSIVVAENRTIRFQSRFQGCNLARAAGWSAWPDRQLSCFLSQESWQRQFLSHSWPKSSWTLWSKITFMGTGTEVELFFQIHTEFWDDWVLNMNLNFVSLILLIKTGSCQKNWMIKLIRIKLTLNISRISLSIEFSKCLLTWY